MIRACNIYKRKRQRGTHSKFWPGNLKERDQFRDFHTDERIRLKLIYKNGMRAWTGFC
jgi:hypothetical protein